MRIRAEPVRPFYRDDIFYSGSLYRLPEYRSSVGVHFIVVFSLPKVTFSCPLDNKHDITFVVIIVIHFSISLV